MCSPIFRPFCCSPTGRTSLAARGAWHIWVTTDQGQRGGRVSAGWLVEPGYRATPPGLRLALHRNHHVALRVSMTLRSVWCTTSKLRVQAAPSVLEPARTTYSSEPSRFSAWESVFRLRSITSATLVHRGAARAAIRRCSGCWRGALGPGQGVPGWRGTLSGWWASPGPLGVPLPAYKLIQAYKNSATRESERWRPT